MDFGPIQRARREPAERWPETDLLFHFARASHAVSIALPCGDRDDRSTLLVASFGEREKKHDERKKSLGSKIFVVDPVPLLTIRHRRECIRWTL